MIIYKSEERPFPEVKRSFLCHFISNRNPSAIDIFKNKLLVSIVGHHQGTHDGYTHIHQFLQHCGLLFRDEISIIAIAILQAVRENSVKCGLRQNQLDIIPIETYMRLCTIEVRRRPEPKLPVKISRHMQIGAGEYLK